MSRAGFRGDRQTQPGSFEARARRDLRNPWSWTRLAFERVIGFPRYVLRNAGFSQEVTGSTRVRIVTVVWSFLVGASGIGAFVLGIVQLK